MAGEKPIVVVIEDDAASAEALSLVLGDWGAEVVQGVGAQAVREALGARAREVTSIIADFNLGARPNGVEVSAALTLEAPLARVLVLSGSFFGEARAVAARAGYDMMQKPASAEAIIAWLEQRS